MTTVTLEVNGSSVTREVEPRTHLADFLRGDLLLTGTHLGCEQGVCGACTVLIDDKPQRACLAFAVECEGARVTTIEGYADDPVMAALREAFSAHHALQCGYCTPGMLATARDIVLRLGDVTEARIREELSGNICRCTGYVGIVAAIRSVCAGRAPTTMPTPLHARADAAPTASAAAPSRAPSPAVAAPAKSPASGHALEERVRVAAPPDAVWAALTDLHRVAACLPGAEIDAIEGDAVTGRMRVALGPITAAFNGRARVTMDGASREGRIEGTGRDRGGSAATGEAIWRVLPDGDGSLIAVTLSWRLTGAFAQFNRGGLVQDVVRRLAATFAANVEASLRGEVPAPAAKPLGLFSLLWSILTSRLRRRQEGGAG